MSLSLTLSNALSGLQVNQSALQVTSNNIANVNTAGYSRKVVNTSPRVLGSQGAGVEISAITRAVNQFLQRDVRTEAGILGQRQVRSEYLTRMQEMFGSVGDNTSITATIDAFSEALETLANDPESAAARLGAVNGATSTARSLNDLSRQIQSLRDQADREIATAVEEINHQLKVIADLNEKITGHRATGLNTGELEDQRDAALDKISKYMSIQYFERSNGAMVVMTAQGQTLVESQAAELGYSASGAMSADRRYLPPGHPDYPGTIGGIILNPGGASDPKTIASRDITYSLGAGSLSALVEMRDTTLSDLNAQFDELAARLRDELNAVHNQGIGYPGSDILNGTAEMPLGGATAINGTGIVRVGVLDADGNLQAWTDIDLSLMATVDDVVNAINGVAGLSASVDASGRLSIATTAPGTTVAVAEDETSPTSIPIGGTSRGFSHFFGLNDLFTTGLQYSSYSSGTVSTSTRVTTGGTLSFQTKAGTFSVNYMSGQSLDQVARAINDSLSGQGIRAEVQQVSGGVRLVIRNQTDEDFVLTDGGDLLAKLNVRAGIADAAADIAVRQDLAESPDKLSRGILLSDGGGYHIGAADDTIVRRMSELLTTNLSFGNVGGLPGVETTLSGYASSIISFNASSAANAATELTYQESLHRDLLDKSLSFSGVNMDEELTNMVVYQSAYQASARVIQTTNDLFDILVNLV